MSDPSSADLVIVEPDGSLRAPGRAAERKLRERAGRYPLRSDAAGMQILRAARQTQTLARRDLMSGEGISRTTVLEILNMTATAAWRGEMHVFAPEATRVLAIDQGALKHARSTHPDDRLGQVLYRNGLLSKAQLEALVREVDPERRLGQLVLEKGFLSQDILFQQLQKQVEQIFFASLLAREGTYAFLSEDSGEAPVHTVHLPIAGLLMEGVQRIDEMALFRERIPHDDLVPEVQPRTAASDVDENAKTVLAYADGERTVEIISRETGLGTFHTVKALYGLLQQGLVILRARRSLDAGAVRRLVTDFNMVLRDIFMAVATYGGVDQTRSTLEAWISGSGYGPIFGERVEEDGALDAEVVANAMLSIQVENPMEGLLQALHELSAFALFAATTTLPRDQELTLSRDVSQRLKKIRL
ncbi:MAG: DUF4388 domain-containing protein [Deltaproteobacteria bacterium]